MKTVSKSRGHLLLQTKFLALTVLLLATMLPARAEDAPGDSGIHIDAQFPGGNIIVDQIDGDRVAVRQDLRDTKQFWFYWCFRVRGAQGRQLTFTFKDKWVIGVRGPAVSFDDGRTWHWLEGVKTSAAGNTFTYAFPADATEVKFSQGMPYQQRELEAFLARHSGDPALVAGELCKTAKGRSVEMLRLGAVNRRPDFRVVFTARHHAAEMMASYEIEGVMEEILARSPAGEWLRQHVEFLVVPFMDKDGVEDGDQGKHRSPHDHNRDYGPEPLYASVRAVKEHVPAWIGDVPALTFDMHCPALRNYWHQVILATGLREESARKARIEGFLQVLEETQTGPLRFRLAHSRGFPGWEAPPLSAEALAAASLPVTRPPLPKPVGGEVFPRRAGPPPTGSSSWMSTIPGVYFSTTFEFPFAIADGRVVDQAAARAFGRDIARALHVYLEPFLAQ